MEEMGFKKELYDIYSSIPEFKCEPNCHDCCGPIHWSPVEDMVIQEFMKKNNIKDIHWSTDDYIKNDLLCPYLKDGKCIIYPVRPIVCRLQGHVKKLPCPYNNNFDISNQLEDVIVRQLNDLNNKLILSMENKL